MVCGLYKTIATVHSEADEFQHLIQRQEKVDALRSSVQEKLRMNEALMKLLLSLDSVTGVDPTVREARRKVSRQIVGLQEIVDAIVQEDMEGFWGGCSGGFGRDYWNDVVAEMEEGWCRERGGEEMERFSAEYLGFRFARRRDIRGAPQLPWLVHPHNPRSKIFSSLTNGQVHKLRLPPGGWWFYGSSKGWLIMVKGKGLNAEILVLNPISGAQHKVPSFHDESVVIDHEADSFLENIELSSPNESECMVAARSF
ncbi:BAG family molecular chaperone regulator 5, mitochondrial [Rosa chinensis]|uniref:BAG family molecular chaperone regulator 5, mitochondrial n=1 Tax=Rosa chinensis TaxID=74649 RepID=UPI000D0955B9|nr:BAG family molecular chaperone regulator 5, mitochondrial [Rosa chinensis]